MDSITFSNQPTLGNEVASTRYLYDQTVTPLGEHALPSEQVAPTRISSAPHDNGASDDDAAGDADDDYFPPSKVSSAEAPPQNALGFPGMSYNYHTPHYHPVRTLMPMLSSDV